MNRFTRDGRHPNTAEHADPFNASLRGVRVEDQGSVSGSEDDAASYYLTYPDPHKMDTDIDDDSNNSLTSQTLNPDGTPKRPMNAFMIFARRRRPQVSAENQSMRTGDVSKILSREWNAMDLSEKQFYLDQAKQLKDNFNLKYPDYVYRRRPNNSRKKRRPDSSTMAVDSASGDFVDDQSPFPEYGEISPVEYHDSQERYESSGPEVRYPSAAPEPTYDAPYQPPARASSYQPSDSLPYHPYGGSDRRAPHLSPHERAPPDTAMGQSAPSASRGQTSTPYYPPFAPNASNPQAASYFQSQPGSEGQWHPSSHPSREDLGRSSAQSWSQSGQESSLHSVDDRQRQYQVAQASPASWMNANSSEPLASNNPPAHASGYSFPTLNSPFYPQQNSPHGYAGQHSSQMSDSPHQYGDVGHGQGSSAASRQEAAYHGHHYSQASTIQAGYTQNSGSNMYPYQTHSRSAILSAPLPSTSTYPHQQSMNTTSPTRSATDPSSQ